MELIIREKLSHFSKRLYGKKSFGLSCWFVYLQFWTKLPGSKSAGRVQSVALRLITEREHEIELFKPEEFWSIASNFQYDDKLINLNYLFLEKK